MGTMVTLAANGIDDPTADSFFATIEKLEALLSRFRPESELSQVAAGRLTLDQADPALREVVVQCEHVRTLTDGDFEFEPDNATTDAPSIDVNALAKGWIIDRATLALKLGGASDFFVAAGGDVVVSRPTGARPFRVGIQDPRDSTAVLGAMELTHGAVATSGTYYRGDHIRTTDTASKLTSATVVGPELYLADALATAVFSSAQHQPSWWQNIDPSYGLLTLDNANTLRWTPPTVGAGKHELVRWRQAPSH